MINNKTLKRLIKAAVVFLLLSVILCVSMICVYNGRSKDKQRQDNTVFEQVPDRLRELALEDSMKAKMAAGKDGRMIIVIDAGHGKQSSLMTDKEKAEEGYVYNDACGEWGEWRHYKNGTFGENCEGDGCTGTVPENGSCWYPISNGDRDIEPDINLNNALAAKKYLEQMGYEVRMARTSNAQNPSMDRRVSCCFENNDIHEAADAAAYICIHSNAGGGSGTSYISLSGQYSQSGIQYDYADRSNALAKILNTNIALASGLAENAPIDGEEYLILFNKCPVPIAYLEIGFFDNISDLELLNSSSDAIGHAIAKGIDEYFLNN